MKILGLIAIVVCLFATACNKRKTYWCVCRNEAGIEYRRALVSGETYEEAFISCVPSGNSTECVLEDY